MIKRAVGVQFHPWDDVYHFDGQDLSLAAGDRVLVKTESGVELGVVVNFSEVDEATLDAPLPPIIKRADIEDLKKVERQNQHKEEVLETARQFVKQHNLPMKLTDCYYSFDGGRMTFIFTADGRVDFRELVKDLARTFQKSIRLQQIGIRDETKRAGGFGPCGRPLCCKGFLHSLGNVTTDLAKLQLVHGRGSDRISGSCGRLMCCLAFEAGFYEKESQHFPPLDAQVKTRQGQGTVVSYNVLKQTVLVKIDDAQLEVPLKEVKRL
jgi:cell fate regulator YaaT (PSP1 superfamily)